eukprot:scaffold396202_cov76-Attheya_sp.AAC.2
MHAGAVLQHYLQCKRSGQFDHKMLDLSSFIQEHMTTEELRAFLVKGGGGNSLDFLMKITQLPSRSIQSISIPIRSTAENGFKSLTKHIVDHFSEFKEPALVSKFLIEQKFVNREDDADVCFDYEVDQAKFDEYADSNNRTTRALHSMVLIGVHQENGINGEMGKVWFLLQNCWKGKYFLMVSAEYMASCEATITFVNTHGKVALTEDFAVIEGMYAETVETPEECAESNEVWVEY